MIINIRGTSGSGKTHLVKRVMDLYATRNRVYVEGRKRPLLYLCQRRGDTAESYHPLTVVGHYETPCGGCDTITDQDQIYKIIRQSAGREWRYDVLYEGLLVSAETRRCIELAKDGAPLLVIALNTPLEECLASVNARRREKRGEDAPGVNPKNTENKFKGVKSAMRKLQAEGVSAEFLNRETAFVKIAEALRIQ